MGLELIRKLKKENSLLSSEHALEHFQAQDLE